MHPILSRLARPPVRTALAAVLLAAPTVAVVVVHDAQPAAADLVSVSPTWASDDCDAYPTTSPQIVEGYIGDAYVKMRYGSPDGSNTWFCVATEAAGVHVGGKVVFHSLPTYRLGWDDGTQPVESRPSSQCANEPSNRRVVSGFVANQPYLLDFVPSPSPSPPPSSEGPWLCLRVGDTIGFRLTFTHPDPTPEVVVDSPVAHAPPYAERAWPAPPGAESAACMGQPGAIRVVNAYVVGYDVALYGWVESPTRVHLCARVKDTYGDVLPSSYGSHILYDAGTLLGVSPDTSPCTFTWLSATAVFALATNDPSAPVPTQICATVVGVAGIRFTVLRGGDLLPEIRTDAA